MTAAGAKAGVGIGGLEINNGYRKKLVLLNQRNDSQPTMLAVNKNLLVQAMLVNQTEMGLGEGYQIAVDCIGNWSLLQSVLEDLHDAWNMFQFFWAGVAVLDLVLLVRVAACDLGQDVGSVGENCCQNLRSALCCSSEFHLGVLEEWPEVFEQSCEQWSEMLAKIF